jgi:hypothetical protein
VKRKLFNFATVFSALLCLATVVLWVRSYAYRNMIGYWFAPDDRGLRVAWSVWATRGMAGFGTENSLQAIQPGWEISSGFEPDRIMPTSDGWYVLGFSSHRFASFNENGLGTVPATFSAQAPAWALSLATSVLPILWLLLHDRRRHHVRRCASCRYDLAGNISGVCPECGTVIVGKAET